MQRYAEILFWILLSSLITYAPPFDEPLLSSLTAGWVLSVAGCNLSSFDIAASCPPGSIVSWFVALHQFVLLSVVNPITFVKQFLDVVAIWCGIVLFVAFFAAERR